MPAISRRRFLQGVGLAALAGACPGRAADVPLAARAVTRGPKHHFFGYYDKCPWDRTGRYLLAQQNDYCNRQPKPDEAVVVGMIDLKDGDRFLPLDRTRAWSWQQGSMLQWLGSAPDREIVYNSIADERAVAVIRDVQTGQTRTLSRPIYALSADGTQAVTLDFARLHRLRPGYGYASLTERFADDPAPEQLGVWWMDVKTGKDRLIVSLAKLAANRPDERFKGAHHWVNHLQFNPCGTRFLFLHRWRLLEKTWWTRLYVAKPDGSDLRLVWDNGMVSHFDWRDDHTILAWTRTRDKGDGFYLYDLDTDKVQQVGPDVLTRDGHCSYSPDRKWVLNDTYPDAKRLQTLMLYRVADGRRFDVGRYYLAPELAGPVRCDLHPRWNRDGTQVCFDSAHDGTRQMYVVDVKRIVKEG